MTNAFGQLEGWNSVSGGSGSDDFLSMKDDGNYILRTATSEPPFQYSIHWTASVDGKPRKVNCAGRDCVLCKEGTDAAQMKFMTVVIERSTGKVKIFEFGKQIFLQLKKHAQDPDWGSLDQYDIKVTKNRAAGPSGMYGVVANPRNMGPLTAEEQVKVQEFMSRVDLNRLSAPSTNAEIEKKLGRTEPTPASNASTFTARSSVAAPATAATTPDEDFDF